MQIHLPVLQSGQFIWIYIQGHFLYKSSGSNPGILYPLTRIQNVQVGITCFESGKLIGHLCMACMKINKAVNKELTVKVHDYSTRCLNCTIRVFDHSLQSIKTWVSYDDPVVVLIRSI